VQYGALRALDHVDLDIQPGQLVALAGENGAGKSTLVRCIAGDITPNGGQVLIKGQRLSFDPRAASRLGIAVVWQNLALCDNLDIAANLLLGSETRRLMLSETRLYARASSLLDELGIPLPDPSTKVGYLSGGQRQLVAVARAMRNRPQLLILDEPTASLGVFETAQVEELAATLPSQGTTVLFVSHDIEQMFRLADRIVILRQGRVVAEVEPAQSHPDEVAALLSGQSLDESARRQLSRLHSLADQLASAEPSSSLSLILAALGAALGTAKVCIHVSDGSTLRLEGMTGLPRSLAVAWHTLPSGVMGGQIGQAAATGAEVISSDVRSAPSWARYRREARQTGLQASWSVPFTGASGVTGVVTVICQNRGDPTRDELNLVALYAGYAASALERDRLHGELTERNKILETIREVLETLAGPVPLADGLAVALQALQTGLGATEVALLTSSPGEPVACRGWAGTEAERSRLGLVAPSPELRAVADRVLEGGGSGEARRSRSAGEGGWDMAVAFPAPDGLSALVARWQEDSDGPDHRALFDDAANSLRLALEREASERAQREAIALRSSQELQRQFLSWLSHELRTPLTAIRGYASSLMQPDVSWDGTSQRRFLERISDESARLGRLVEDLLDFSAIDAGILRLHPDWCDLALVLEAARSCLASEAADQVDLRCSPELPVIWADHDRLEQVFLNLLDNAVRHNPQGTVVFVDAAPSSDNIGVVTVDVTDRGIGIPPDRTSGPLEGKAKRRARTAGAGLGLSIAKGIVHAHGGRFEVTRIPEGTRCRVHLPVALGAPVSDITGTYG
jgi:signal transduction histidine kinase/ABC-type multidrug transport system ATPase subunit